MKLASLEAIARVLDESGVRYLIVGGLAVAAYGYGRLTYDVDLVLRMDPINIRAAFSALAKLGYQPRVPVTAEEFSDPGLRRRWIEEKNMTVLNLWSDQHRETPIDIFVTEPFDFDREYADALLERLAPGLFLRFVPIETLIEMKQAAGRDQDRIDIAQLRRIMSERL